VEEKLVIFLAKGTDLAYLDEISRVANLQDVDNLVAKRDDTEKIIIKEGAGAVREVYEIIAEGLFVEDNAVVESGYHILFYL
jgi:hypothetical protein